MDVMSTSRSSPSASVTPSTRIVTNLWFGGEITLLLATAFVQSGTALTGTGVGVRVGSGVRVGLGVLVGSGVLVGAGVLVGVLVAVVVCVAVAVLVGVAVGV